MKKMPTLFVRDPDDRAHVLDQVNPGCEWALNGEGRATRKWDGTCIKIDDERQWWTRREVKPGKLAPSGWVQVDHDVVTGKRMGWEPWFHSGFAKHMADLFGRNAANGDVLEPGTYELIGPKINGNPDMVSDHMLRKHGDVIINGWKPTSFEEVRLGVTRLSWEGVVFHHPDGRMCKIKRKDFT